MCENVTTNVYVQFLLFCFKWEGNVCPALEKDMFVSPIGCLFLFSCSQNCLHFCTQLSQCTHNSQLCMRWLKLKVVSSAQIKSHRHVIHVCTCAFLLLSLYFLDPFIKNNLSGHVADTNTALLRQKRVWPFGQNSSPTGYEPNVIDNFDYSKTAEIFFQEQSGDTMPSYLHDAELSDETIGKALSSPRFTQEREEPAGRRQAYHSFEESLLPSRSLSVCHVSTGRPVNEQSSLSSCSSRQMENETKEELPRNLQEKIDWRLPRSNFILPGLECQDSLHPWCQRREVPRCWDWRRAHQEFAGFTTVPSGAEASASLLQVYHSQKRKLVSTCTVNFSKYGETRNAPSV